MPRWSWIFFILLFISLVGLQIHNVRNYPVTNGFDARAHIEYIAWLKKHTSLPLATAGWEFHQPPLYYVVNQSLPTLKSSPVFGVLVWIVAAAVILLFFRKHCGPLPSIILTLLAAALPLGLYLSPAISNEWTSTVLLTIALSYYVNHFLSDTPQINQPKSETTVPKQLILGILLSLCLLTKVTAIVFVASLVLDQLVRKKGNILLLLRQTWLTLLTISVLSGWFFVRNWWLFGNPLFQAADYIPLSSFAQPIIERNVFFFSNLHPLLSLTLFEAQYTSFWGGTYLSWFYDGHGVLLPPQAFTKAGSLLINLYGHLLITNRCKISVAL